MGEVAWREWTPEAFAEAAAADKPILLSISAVWCHWCHVMDHTTYSNEGVAEIINRDYVPIRVDNDVRPDINQRYNMGGWPTTAFLTPAGDILTGATYLPPEQMGDALVKIAAYYRASKPEIVAKVLEGRQRAQSQVAASAGSLDRGLVDRVLGAVENAYDQVYGGFGSAPKFPQTDAVALLAEQSVLKREPRLLEMARHTLEQMAAGGTYDHVEGGFFRYSTTQDWSVPHFEKMLEDHAGLLYGLGLAGLPDIADDAVRYLDTVLRDPASGLYAGSQDADERYYSLDAEGRSRLDPPFVDRRVYAAWNCALAVGLLEASVRLDRPGLREAAARLLDSLFDRLYNPARGLDRLEGVGGQLGDQVYGLWAAVRAAAAGLGERWARTAHELVGILDERYGDADLGGYFDREAGSELGRLGERIKPLAENSVAAIALLELEALLGDPESGHRRRAQGALESVASLPRQYGLMAAVFARALDRLNRPLVKVTTSDAGLARHALATYPYAVIESGGDGHAIVCIGTECLAPVDTPEALEQSLQARV